MNNIITILGIDPGSRITGYGIIRSNGQKHAYVTSGTVNTKGDDITTRLVQIFHGIQTLTQTYLPDETAIEQVFMAKDANAALKLGQARGVAMVAMANEGLVVAEYAARAVKKAVVGYGAADKAQVQHMVKLLLNLTETPTTDAADALAVAICHAHSRSMSDRLGSRPK
jgi:crossover junction endodeoxyribonuclease RuvC